MVVTLVIIALVICKLRGNLKALLPIGKIMIGEANSGEINQVRQTLRTLLDLTPGHQLPPELPEKRKPLSANTRNFQSISEVNSAFFKGYPEV